MQIPGNLFFNYFKICNMNKSFLLTVLLVIILSISCRTIIKKMYGVKKPAFEKPENIEKFKNEVFGNNVTYMIVSYDSWKQGKLFPVPEIFVFDRTGNHIPYKDTLRLNCNGPAELFISQLDKSRKYFYDTLTRNQFIRRLDYPVNSNLTVENDSADFHVYITWANWAGKKLIREKSFDWINAIYNNKYADISLTLINQDLQDSWSDAQKKYLEQNE